MKNFLIIFALLCAVEINAQTYLISFEGTGESFSVSGVKVENLTAGTSLNLNSGERLRLSGATSIADAGSRLLSGIGIYPNPVTENSVIRITPPYAGNALISVSDMSGKKLGEFSYYLEANNQEFVLSGLGNGFYLISAEGKNYHYSEKLISVAESSGVIRMNKISGNIKPDAKEKPGKGSEIVSPTIDMAYTDGDLIKFSGTSGIYSTVVMLVPTADKTITFDFVQCTDGDNNNYPVVKIGDQIWMAENIKATQYTSATPIPLTNSDEAWMALGLTNKGHCYFDDNPDNGAVYGALYNWNAAMNSGSKELPAYTQGVCPVGWHIPGAAEWNTLIASAGALPGAKLKETGFTHWSSGGVAGTNESGFSAVGGGFRYANPGNCDNLDIDGIWWSATSTSGYNVNVFNLSYSDSEASVGENGITKGLSVRCVKD